ncbi:GNAT family N-acetyltransferase [Rhodovulum sulfidophilum]|uniref:GNAT family N-acetyltransferase n=1 Tax=Rhodovulum sulfidophilum TaxID=35806 RepID=UPI001EEF5A4F|nr:GNAT family N-acetyltransferase [Rhodovulum sulfidophilum]
MNIRDFRPGDSAMLASIFHEAVHAVGSRDYSPEQVAAWSPAPVPAEQFLARISDGRSVFVAVTGSDAPIAFIELEEDGHIDCFYCSPEFVGHGVGKALYQRLETAALAMGLSRLHVEASEAAGVRAKRRQDPQLSYGKDLALRARGSPLRREIRGQALPGASRSAGLSASAWSR